jgi:hypothetical protein
VIPQLHRLPSDDPNVSAFEVYFDPLPEERGERTRRVIRAEVCRALTDPSRAVKISLHYQRRHPKTNKWDNTKAFDLRCVCGGEYVQIRLSPTETAQLLEVLHGLYAMADRGVPTGTKSVEVVPEERAIPMDDARATQIVATLFQQLNGRIGPILESLPSEAEVVEAVALRREQARRRAAVDEFRSSIDDDKKKEGYWEEFFKGNEWIFGQGLDYRYLSKLQGQAYYGGRELDDRDGLRGDYLMITKAKVGFTVLVDIKSP